MTAHLHTHRTSCTAAAALSHFWLSAAHMRRIEQQRWWGSAFIYIVAPFTFGIVTVDYQTGPSARQAAEECVRARYADAQPVIAREFFHTGQARDTALRSASVTS